MPIVPIRSGPNADRIQPKPVDNWAPPAPEVYQLMAAAQMHREGRLVQDNAPPIDESGNYSSAAKMFGAVDPPIHAVDDKHYPNDIDARIGKQVDQTYGDKVAPFLQPGANVSKMPLADVNKDPDKLFEIDAKPATPEQRDQILKNWQAAQKSPLSALGFDPRNTTILENPEQRQLTLGGEYDTKKDRLWYNNAHEDSAVHESLHRGIELLKRAGDLPQEYIEYASTHRNAEELLVRAFKIKYFGEIERHKGADVGNGQVSDAHWRLESDGMVGKLFRGAMDALERAAADHIAKHKPGGPR